MMGSLEWIKPAKRMPDAEERVLLWLREPDGSLDWASGNHNGGRWLLDWCGAPPAGQVLAWARPQGPA